MSDVEFNLYKPQPLLIVISGVSGVGKDSVLREMRKCGQPFHFVVTATTRQPRADEVDGRDYIFITVEKFESMVKNGEFLEHANVYGELKGVPREQVRQALASGKDVVMRLDVQGAATIRSLAPDAVLIFLTTTSEEELIQRLKNRRTDKAVDLNVRLAEAHKELKRASEFDYVVVNEDGKLNAATQTVISIIEAEHHRINPRKIDL